MVDDIQVHYSDLSSNVQEQGFIKTGTEILVPKKTTHGLVILAEFKYGSSNWINMKDLTQSNPV